MSTLSLHPGSLRMILANLKPISMFKPEGESSAVPSGLLPVWVLLEGEAGFTPRVNLAGHRCGGHSVCLVSFLWTHPVGIG